MKRRLKFYLHRLRYDSWLMLFLNITKPFGIAFCPFYLYREQLQDDQGQPRHRLPEGIEVRPLTRGDMEQLSSFPDRNYHYEKLRKRFNNEDLGLGAWAGTELAAFTWATTGAITETVLRTSLAPHQAYLYDAYTARGWRGRSLAPALREVLYRKLADRGLTELYSFTLVGNNPAKKFKEKLGAEKIDTGLYVRLFRWRFQLPNQFKCFTATR